jgi:hypothetical protein
MRFSFHLFIGTALVLLISSGAHAQSGLNLPSTIINPQQIAVPGQSLALPFSGVRVLDLRFDTSKLGYLLNGNTFNKAVLHNTGPALEQYMSTHYRWQSKEADQLLLIVRTLWITNRRAGEGTEHNESKDSKFQGNLVVKIDAFAFSPAGCKTLKRIDTSMLSQPVTKSNAGNIIAELTQIILEKFSDLDAVAATNGKKLIPLNEIESHYLSFHDKPAIKQPSGQRGIYASFNDFLNNRAKTESFTLEQTESADYLYLEKGNEQILFTDFWGFHDGENLYIRVGSNFFKLFKDQNAYSFTGCTQSVHKSKARSQGRIVRNLIWGNFGEAHQSRLVNMLRPMQVNMDTGSVY